MDSYNHKNSSYLSSIVNSENINAYSDVYSYIKSSWERSKAEYYKYALRNLLNKP